MTPRPLLAAAKSKRLIPFIGAGFSRVFNLPTWGTLIEQISEHIGFAPEIASLYGDFLQIAEYLSLQQNGLSSLRSQMDKVFNSPSIRVQDSRAHILLTKLQAASIYTTNWDNLIERAFDYESKSYNKIASAYDLRNADSSKPSIVKFHGDFSSNDDSLVFTESSYFERLGFESPLDVRLRADMLANTLLFLGYSLSDINVRYMWFKLQKLISQQHFKKRPDPFAYIVAAQQNPVFEEICKHSRDIGVIFLDPIDPQGSLIQFLDELVNQIEKP